MSYRVYILDGGKNLTNVSITEYNRFANGETVYPQHAGESVRFVEAFFSYVGGKPRSLLRVNYTIHPIDESGKLDQEQIEEKLQFAMKSFYNEFAQIESDRLYKWQPTECEQLLIEKHLEREINNS